MKCKVGHLKIGNEKDIQQIHKATKGNETAQMMFFLNYVKQHCMEESTTEMACIKHNMGNLSMWSRARAQHLYVCSFFEVASRPSATHSSSIPTTVCAFPLSRKLQSPNCSVFQLLVKWSKLYVSLHARRWAFETMRPISRDYQTVTEHKVSYQSLSGPK